MILSAFWLPYIVGAVVAITIMLIFISIIVEHISLYGIRNKIRCMRQRNIQIYERPYHDLIEQVLQDYPGTDPVIAGDASDAEKNNWFPILAGNVKTFYTKKDGRYIDVRQIKTSKEVEVVSEQTYWDKNKEAILRLNDEAVEKGELVVQIPVDMYENEYEAIACLEDEGFQNVRSSEEGIQFDTLFY